MNTGRYCLYINVLIPRDLRMVNMVFKTFDKLSFFRVTLIWYHKKILCFSITNTFVDFVRRSLSFENEVTCNFMSEFFLL